MNIDERLLAYKPISVILNFDWDKMSYDERVLARHNYIEEQKKKDPNYVGYDFIEHFSTERGGHKPSEYLIVHTRLVSTIGQIFSVSNRGLWITFGTGVNGYKDICINGSKNKRLKAHRIVACTFIPIPEHLKENRYKLVVNHKNDIKSCNLRSNLEWCTNQENATKAVDTGAISSTPFKFTITRPGEYLGKEYYFTSKYSLKAHGFSQANIHNAINNNKIHLCGMWERITKEELKNKQLGMNKDVIEYIRDPKYGKANATGWVGTIISDGPCKGEKFVLYGRNQLNKYGLEHSHIGDYIKGKRKSYKSCTWERMTREEAVNIPIGLTEQQMEHILAK